MSWDKLFMFMWVALVHQIVTNCSLMWLISIVQIGTMGLASFKTACETSCTTQDADGNDVTDQACMDNVSNCVDDAILNLATCILPTISGTPATP